MTLGIKDRLILPRLLPQSGTYHQLVTIRNLIEKVDVSDEELKELGITKTPQGGLDGVEENDVEKGYEFTPEECAI